MLGQFDELMQERRNSIANALELRLSFTKPIEWSIVLLHLLPLSFRQYSFFLFQAYEAKEASGDLTLSSLNARGLTDTMAAELSALLAKKKAALRVRSYLSVTC